MEHDTNTVTLTSPITRGELEITELTIRKPKTGALRGLALTDVIKMETDAMLKLVPRVTTPAITEHEVAGLDLADYVSVATAVIGFFAPITVTETPGS